MATLNEIKRKIGAVKKTRQITKAMNMVAAARLRSSQTRMEQFKPYAEKFSEVLESLAVRADSDAHPLLVTREAVSATELILVTSDRGLCGSYNTSLIFEAQKWIREQQAQGHDAKLTVIGRKGRDYFRRRRYEFRNQYVDHYGSYDFSVAHEIAQKCTDGFLLGEVDEVYVLYSEFVHVAVQRPKLRKLIPMSPVAGESEERSTPTEYLFEPSPEELLIELLPKNMDVQMTSVLLEAVASEYAARMSAMDKAYSNCNDMIDSLTLVFNKARQAEITSELMDIVGGAEALKG